jgi:Tol biopolymer transport system component
MVDSALMGLLGLRALRAEQQGAMLHWNPLNPEREIIYNDQKNDDIISTILDFDGHCSFSPDQNLIVTDRKYRSTMDQALLLYNLQTRQKVELCRCAMQDKKYMSGDIRCDFHPRWSRNGDQICFDAIEPENGTRQLHIAYVKGI